MRLKPFFLMIFALFLFVGSAYALDEAEICEALVTEVAAGSSQPTRGQLDYYRRNNCDDHLGQSLDGAVTQERLRLSNEQEKKIRELMRYESGG
jgi:hypothetical protein